MPHVLVIEDDPSVRRGLVRTLTDRDFAASSAATGLAGLEKAVSARPDVIVLDLGLPDLDGSEILRMVRAVSDVPILIATACDEERQIVSMLAAGADDYIVKPFGGEQFVARVQALLRRGRRYVGRFQATLRVGGLVLEPSAHTVELDGQPLVLTPKEFALLRYLLERVGQVVTKRELLIEVWRLPYRENDKTVDVHLSWLRRKLGESAHTPRYLHTVRGVGLRLVEPAH